jgi:hypothetical protein
MNGIGRLQPRNARQLKILRSQTYLLIDVDEDDVSLIEKRG